MKTHIIGRPPPASSIDEHEIQYQQGEARNRRLNQLYKSLMQCNQAIIRSENETELFAQICRNVVDFDCTKMAFITLLDEQKQRLLPVTSYGSDTEYIESLHITVAENSPHGHGPIGIAFREDMPYWCQDFQQNPVTLPWRTLASRFGWRACAALPLHKNGAVIGTLNVYADESNVFDSITQKLLCELAIDIDHALARFELESERRQSLKMKTLRVFMLELITSELSLQDVLDGTVRQFEQLIPNSMCSVILRDKESKQLRLGAAPSLPTSYITTLDRMPLSPGAGCINAIFHGVRTITVDIPNDMSWGKFRQQAKEMGIGASCSEPIFSASAQILGAFTVYHRSPFHPAASDLQLLETAAHFLAIAIERKQSEAFMRKLSQAVEQSSNAIIITDLNGIIEYANRTFSTNTGHALQEIIGKKPNLHKSGKTSRATYADMWAHLGRGESWQGEFINRRHNGEERIDLVRVSPVREVDGRITHYLAIEEDITNQKNAQARIESLAHFDVLTGLPNRALLDERAQRALRLAEEDHATLAVMFLDLDHFKNINDTLGHNLGDTLLIELARRLRAVLRRDDTLSRLGGDEFVLLLPGANRESAKKIAQELMRAINEPYRIGSHELNVMASIGIAVYPADGMDFETLCKNADVAMYRVKQEGRNGYRSFTQEMQAYSTRYLQVLNALRQAISHEQLHVHYQPQISLVNGEVIGVEALLRWRHPELGNISPAEFIPIAEESGLILQIGEWVLRAAVAQAKKWHLLGMEKLIMAVNLSAVQFRHAGLPNLVMNILKEEDFPPQYLELELTEGVAMHDPQGAIATMNNLHERGVRMSIDDFGTGYSSLSYLKQFKVYKLKIDQSFVRDISNGGEDKAIVSAIICMAKSLGLQTIAEGVETVEQLDFLREEGCHEVQGYHYSKPLPAAAFEAFMLERPLLHKL